MGYDPTKPLWSIMTKSRGGTVSIIRDLTLDQVKRTYERLDPWYDHHSVSFFIHKDFVKEGGRRTISGGPGSSSAQRNCTDGDIEVREVFGPAGWAGFAPGEVECWPKHHVVYTDENGAILSDEYQKEPELAERHRNYREAALKPVSSPARNPSADAVVRVPPSPTLPEG